LEDLEISNIDIIHVNYTENPDKRFFTALISASARDFYVNDSTNMLLRGDSEPAEFQEVLTFLFQNKTWLLGRVQQTKETTICTMKTCLNNLHLLDATKFMGIPPARTEWLVRRCPSPNFKA